jgi:flagellar hook-basal body complex protein FliE
MSPIPAINPAMSGMMPNVDALTPGVTPLPSTSIEMPSELGRAQEITSAHPTSDSFASMLGQMVSDVNAKQNISAQAVSALQSGQTVPLHQAVIAMEEANVSFQLMVEVRNRLLESYQEIMRMQI